MLRRLTPGATRTRSFEPADRHLNLRGMERSHGPGAPGKTDQERERERWERAKPSPKWC